MGSDESHFNVSVGSDGQSHWTVSTNHNLSEEKGEPKRYRTEVADLKQSRVILNAAIRDCLCAFQHIVQELCESRGGRLGLSVLTSLLVSVEVKLY